MQTLSASENDDDLIATGTPWHLSVGGVHYVFSLSTSLWLDTAVKTRLLSAIVTYLLQQIQCENCN